jgi:hypothetical protein
MANKIACLLLALALLPAAASGKKHRRGQQQPDPQRVLQIQQALLDRGYISFQPNGAWDEATLAPLRKIADDRGWQTTNVPDARVLILLGLGGPNADMSVTLLRGNSLDEWQRKTALEKHK